IAQKVNINVSRATFRTVMTTIQQQTNYSFVAREALLKKAKPISITIKSKEITDVLPLLFEGQPFTYQVNGKVITLKEISKTKGAETSLRSDRNVLQQTIHGKVTSESGD